MEEQREFRDGFVFYHSWWIAIVNLPREAQFDAIKAIMEYGFKGAECEQLRPIARAILTMAKPQIDTNYKRWKNGSKGGCPKGYKNNPNGRKGKENNQKLSENKPISNQKLTKNKPKDKVKEKDINIKSFIDIKDSSNSCESDNSSGIEIEFESLMKYFNAEIEKHSSSIPKINKFSEERKKLVKCRCREYGKEALIKVIQNAVTSAFLNGSAGFIASFDWMIRPRNFLKILEGNYNNKSNNNANSRSGSDPNWSGNNGIKFRGAVDFDCGLIED